MTVQAMVDRRQQSELHREDPAKLIAYAAHDLMTPLTALQLSLSLLTDDEEVNSKLNSHQQELLTSASSCSDLMVRICEAAIKSMRQHPSVSNAASAKPTNLERSQSLVMDEASSFTDMVDLVKSLKLIMEPIPKQVPLIISLDPSVPSVISSDDLRLFRSALNLMSCATQRTTTGKVHVRFFVREDPVDETTPGNVETTRSLVVECEDTAEDIPLADYQYLYQEVSGSSGGDDNHFLLLSLSSVASLVKSMKGDFGFRPRSQPPEGAPAPDSSQPHRHGSIFWFSVLLKPHVQSGASSLEGKPQSACLQLKGNRSDIQVPNEGLKRSLSGLLRRRRTGNKSYVPMMLRCGSNSSVSLHSSYSSSRQLSPMYSSRSTGSLGGLTGGISMASSSGGANAVFDVPKAVKNGGTTGDNPSLSRSNSLNSRATALASRMIMAGRRDAASSNEGSTAPVSVPDGTSITGSTDATASLTALQPATNSSGQREKYALVIEDSLVVRKGLARALSKLGFHVQQAVNGLEGLKELKATLFDMVLCDFLMPVMDGLDCVKQYREWELENRPTFRQPIIGISAHVSVSDSELGIKAGMDGFRPKPISIKTLTELQENESVVNASRQLDVAATLSCPTNVVDDSFEGSVDKRKSSPASETDQRDSKKARISSNPSHPVCLIAMDTPTLGSNNFLKKLESTGWKVVVVHDGKDTLRLLKMRNWDAVLLADDIPLLPATKCISEFREWEEKNRVNEQRNVLLVCDGDIPSPFDNSSVVQPPSGFNGVLPMPIVWEELDYLVKKRSDTMKIVFRR